MAQEEVDPSPVMDKIAQTPLPIVENVSLFTTVVCVVLTDNL